MINQKVKKFIIITSIIATLVTGIWIFFLLDVLEPTKTTQNILSINIDTPSEVVKFNYNYELSKDAKRYSYLQIANDYLWEITFYTKYRDASTHKHIRSELDNKLYIIAYQSKHTMSDTPAVIDLSLFISKSYIEATARKIEKHE